MKFGVGNSMNNAGSLIVSTGLSSLKMSSSLALSAGNTLGSTGGQVNIRSGFSKESGSGTFSIKRLLM